MSDQLSAGTLYDGRFQIIRLIGSGGTSTVYEAYDQKMERPVAIKRILPHLCRRETDLQRFRQESQVVAQLEHDHIVKIFAVSLDESGTPYLVQELLRGHTLADWQKEGRLPLAAVLAIAHQIAEAVAYAHSRNIVHRDLKPANVFLLGADVAHLSVRLLDFGLAKCLDQDSTAQDLTATGSLLGTPVYMSPEQCRGERLDLRTDIYSLGCIMYEGVSGSPPFTADSALEVMYQHINTNPKLLDLQGLKGKRRQILQDLIMSCLAKQPSQRPQSMTAVASLLAHLQGSGAITTARLQDLFAAVTGRGVPARKQAVLVASLVAALLLATMSARWLVSNQKVPKEKKDEIISRFNALEFDYNRALNGRTDFDAAIAKAKEMIDLARAHADVIDSGSLARAYFQLARVMLIDNGRYPPSETLVVLQKAEDCYHRTGKRDSAGYAAVLWGQATAYRLQRDVKSACRVLRQGIPWVKDEPPAAMKTIELYWLLATSELNAGEPEQAIKTAQEGIAWAQSMPYRQSTIAASEPAQILTLNGIIGHAYTVMKRFDKAQPYQQMVVRSYEETGSPAPSTITTMLDLAVSEERAGRLDKAMQLVDTAFGLVPQIPESFQRHMDISALEVGISMQLRHQQQDKARQTIERIRRMAIQRRLTDVIESCDDLSAQID